MLRLTERRVVPGSLYGVVGEVGASEAAHDGREARRALRGGPPALDGCVAVGLQACLGTAYS